MKQKVLFLFFIVGNLLHFCPPANSMIFLLAKTSKRRVCKRERGYHCYSKRLKNLDRKLPKLGAGFFYSGLGKVNKNGFGDLRKIAGFEKIEWRQKNSESLNEKYALLFKKFGIGKRRFKEELFDALSDEFVKRTYQCEIRDSLFDVNFSHDFNDEQWDAIEAILRKSLKHFLSSIE